jgi:chromosome segregation ATPase
MEDYSVLVAGLEYKVRQLIELKNSQSAEILEMREQIGFFEKENKTLKEQLEKVTEKKQLLELAGLVEASKDPGKLKWKINELIREIDKCIAYFNSQ